jgi:hypothetical protein
MIQDIVRHPERYRHNENENMRRDGARVWIAWTNKAFCNDDGSVREILCVGNDITMLKQAEEKLLKYQKMLQSLASELSLAEERERFLVENMVAPADGLITHIEETEENQYLLLLKRKLILK